MAPGSYAKEARRNQPGTTTFGLVDPQILVVFRPASRAHLPEQVMKISRSGTIPVNTFALVRNAFGTSCLFIALIVTFSCGRAANAQTSQAVFPIASAITLPGHSFPVFIGDFNGDGKPDLAYIDSISSSQSSLGIQLNLGSSTPTTVTTPLCVAGAGPPSFADVNNDKKLDLVYSCNGFLTIQLGNGDGTFQPPAYFSKYSGPPVFADFNGDGYLDIAAFNPNANAPGQVAIFLNQGATAPGVFASPTLYAAPNGATGLSAGDFTEMANGT
jgi:hypothetical protein